MPWKLKRNKLIGVNHGYCHSNDAEGSINYTASVVISNNTYRRLMFENVNSVRCHPHYERETYSKMSTHPYDQSNITPL